MKVQILSPPLSLIEFVPGAILKVPGSLAAGTLITTTPEPPFPGLPSDSGGADPPVPPDPDPVFSVAGEELLPPGLPL